jgi:hippurate hydrolase
VTFNLPDANRIGGVDLEAFYRDLHAHPELAFGEHRTATRIGERLAGLGLEVTTGVGGTGVVGVLRNGEGPVVLLRADMDALPIREQTGLPYSSHAKCVDSDGAQTPVMHACGHDMHVTCLLGALGVLIGTKGDWRGTVLGVFQPAEEVGAGARAMVDDGLFDRFPRPDIVLAQHVSPLPVGTVSYHCGTMAAAADSFRVRLFGRGGHGAMPEYSVDTVVMAASIVMRLQTVVSREVAASDPAVVTVGAMRVGGKENVIPDEGELKINVRTFRAATRTRVLDSIRRIVNAEAQASGAPKEPEITAISSFPLLVSDPDATSATIEGLGQAFGKERLVEIPPAMGSEDAGDLATPIGVPIVYWAFGGSDPAEAADAKAKGVHLPGPHSPFFAPVPSQTIRTGVQALTVAARTWLGSAMAAGA